MLCAVLLISVFVPCATISGYFVILSGCPPTPTPRSVLFCTDSPVPATWAGLGASCRMNESLNMLSNPYVISSADAVIAIFQRGWREGLRFKPEFDPWTGNSSRPLGRPSPAHFHKPRDKPQGCTDVRTH